VFFECSVAFLFDEVIIVSLVFWVSKLLKCDPRGLEAPVILVAMLLVSSSSEPANTWATGAAMSSGINSDLCLISVAREECMLVILDKGEVRLEVRVEVRLGLVRDDDIVGAGGDGGHASVGSFPGRGTCRGTCGSLMMKDSGPDGAVGTTPPEKGVTLVTIG